MNFNSQDSKQELNASPPSDKNLSRNRLAPNNALEGDDGLATPESAEEVMKMKKDSESVLQNFENSQGPLNVASRPSTDNKPPSGQSDRGSQNKVYPAQVLLPQQHQQQQVMRPQPNMMGNNYNNQMAPTYNNQMAPNYSNQTGNNFNSQMPNNYTANYNTNMANNYMPNAGSRFHGDNRGIQRMQTTNADAGAYASTEICSKACTGWLATYLPCCCCCFDKPYKVIPEGYTAAILRFGKFRASVGPGMHYVLPEVDQVVYIDRREIVVDLKKQKVMSKDNTNFVLDSVLYYKITSTAAAFASNNLRGALADLAQVATRNAVGRMTIQQFLEQKEHFAEQIEQEISKTAAGWGAKVLRVLVQDVFLPPEFQNSFSTSAVAKKISEAQIISNKAEVDVARLMRDAADALSTDAAFQIRYIDALEAIQKTGNPKIIFFPADYNDVGSANESLHDELQSLIKK